MGALALAVHHDPRTLPKIHLSLGSRLDLHPHKRDRLRLPQMPDESFDGLVAARETVVTNQVLINALSTQPPPQPPLQSAAKVAGKGSGDRRRTRRSKWLVLNLGTVQSRGAK